jgi:Domain of unknown function (DUF5671)
MDRSLSLQQFLESARSQGLSDDTLMGLLRGRGWPESDVYRALAENYEARTGFQIPAYRRSGSAKDAFLYLLSFSTLATWTIGLGSVMFTLIDRWIRDPLNAPNYYYQGGFYEMADSLACIIIAFPVYIAVMAYIVRTVEAHPEKRDSPVRKWLTYLALLIAAGIVVGDLITFLTYFLRGELTARFVSKVATVLVIAGGVFWYYMTSLKSAAIENPR